MEEIFQRFSHLAEQIFQNLKNEGLAKCREGGRFWQNFIDERNYPWIRIVNIPTILPPSTPMVRTSKVYIPKVCIPKVHIPNVSIPKVCIPKCEHTKGAHIKGAHTKGVHTKGAHTKGTHTKSAHTKGMHTKNYQKNLKKTPHTTQLCLPLKVAVSLKNCLDLLKQVFFNQFSIDLFSITFNNC